ENYFQGLNYKVSNVELEKGLVIVSNDKKLDYMFDVGKSFGRLDLYLDHLETELSEYLVQVDTTEKDACVSIGNLTQLEYL
nr:peroxidase 20 [Tanacetum cinerariifolium]